MSKIKKVLALVLTMAMVLGMAVSAFAATTEHGVTKDTKDATGTTTDRANISVSGVTPETNEDGSDKLTVKAYQIIKANYDNGGKFSGYESLYSSIIKSDQVERDDVTVSADQLAAIIDADKVSGTDYAMTSTDGRTYTAEVPVGTYVVVITNADEKIYSPVVVSVVYKNSNGQTAMEYNDVNVVEADNAWVKVVDKPVLNKIITNSDKTDKGNTVNIGDIVEYKLTTTIPYYAGKYPVFNIVDKLTGLTYDSELKVKVGDTELAPGTDYKVNNPITDEIKIDFVVNNNYTLNTYQGKTLTITYKAKVNQNAALNGNKNTNDATLYFTNDSKVDGNDGFSKDKTYTYTFDIDGTAQGSLTKELITKLGKETNGATVKLDGAEFTLYTKYENGVLSDVYGTVYPENEHFDGVVTTENGGQMTMTGLKAGTYYLKETKAPGSYTLNDTVYTIVIEATVTNEGELTGWTISINGATINSSDHTARSEFKVTNEGPTVTKTEKVNIINTKISNLPSTGGIGTTIFTIGGCAIMIVAAGLFFATRRKTQK